MPDGPGREHVEAQFDLAETALDDATGAVDAGLSDAVVVNRLTTRVSTQPRPCCTTAVTTRVPTGAFSRCSGPRSSSKVTQTVTRDSC